MLGGGATPENRRAVFAMLPPPDKYLLVLDGADHLTFNGGPGQRRSASHDAETARYHRVLKATTLAFWNAYLRGSAEDRAWLAGGARDAVGPRDSWQSK